MSKFKCIALIINCLLLFVVASLHAQPITYTVNIEPRGEKEFKISVDVDFYNDSRDTIFFTLPVRVNDITHIWRLYRGWSVTGGRKIAQDTSYIKIKRTDATTNMMRLHYEVIQPAPGHSVTVDNYAAPIIQDDYIQIPGYLLFLTPSYYKNFDVTVKWANLPKKWRIQNSFNSGSTEQHFVLGNEEWLRTNWVAGDFRILTGKVLGKPVCFAVRGTWLFEDTTLFNIILKTIQTQREQWDDTDIPYYSVTLTPYVMPKRKVDDEVTNSLCIGNGLYQSFMIFADPECLLDNFIDLFNHEMMHNWIGGKIKDGDPDEAHSLRWFIEGYTEYFALRNRWKAGFMSETEFFSELNGEFFRKHYTAQHGELDNTQTELRRWESYDLDRIPYRRGFILALYYDCFIRVQSKDQHNLFDFMEALLEYTYGSDRNLTGGYEYFTEALGDLTGSDPTSFLEIHAFKGKYISAASFVLPPYLELKNDPKGVPQFALNPNMKDAKRLFLKD